MRILFIVAALLCAAIAPPRAQSQVPSDRDMLLAGTETGEVRSAELSGYPSPKRALELVKELKLTDAQVKSLHVIVDEMRPRAIDLGKKIIGVEGEMSDALRTGLISEQSVRDDAEQIGRLRGKLRAVFLTARLKARRVLTAEQLTAYKNVKPQAPAAKH